VPRWLDTHSEEEVAVDACPEKERPGVRAAKR
jgi:hypothetical protein